MAGSETIVAGVAGRYATALFELARDGDELDSVANDLDRLTMLLDESEDLDRALKSPAFSIGDKQRALSAVLEKAGIKGLSARFLMLVAHNNRLSLVRDMVAAFHALLSAHRGEVSAQVISASPLTGPQQETLAKTLKSTIGQDVKIETFVDPDILGGLIVKIGSRMIDSSLRTRLNNLRTAMKEVS